MIKDKITSELENGICELTIVSDHCSASRTISATLSPIHLPDTQSNFTDNPNMVVFWDVIDEKWKTMHVSTIGDIERMNVCMCKLSSVSVRGRKVSPTSSFCAFSSLIFWAKSGAIVFIS